MPRLGAYTTDDAYTSHPICGPVLPSGLSSCNFGGGPLHRSPLGEECDITVVFLQLGHDLGVCRSTLPGIAREDPPIMAGAGFHVFRPELWPLALFLLKNPSKLHRACPRASVAPNNFGEYSLHLCAVFLYGKMWCLASVITQICHIETGYAGFCVTV